MRSLFVFIFFSLFSYNLSSQDKVLLSGLVKNVNQESLVGINIYLTSNKYVGTTSDYTGNYSLELSGELPIKLTFSGIGYETTHITIEEYGIINKDIMEERVARMETTLDRHDSQITKLFSRVDETNKCIQKINNSILQIKWSVYGAIGFYVVTQVGLLEALRVI